MAFNPTSPDQYIGKQLILNSDRIVINSKEDNLLFSNTGFSFSTNGEFHFNTEDKKGNKFVLLAGVFSAAHSDSLQIITI